jgi:3-oxoacyl-[acyl-carrier-protein] synthase-3
LSGLTNAYAFDVNSVCSSAVFAMKLASGLIKDGAHNVLVVASEVYSKILNPKELTTYPYFGDGAGATLITNTVGRYELVDFVLGSDGSGSEVIQVPAGGSMLPGPDVVNPKDYYFKMNGRQVFDFACDKGTEIIQSLSKRNNVNPDMVIPHQANINVIREIGRRSGLPDDQFYVNLDRFANTAGASVLIALDEYLEKHPVHDNIFLVVFGGGLSWAGCYLRRC